jgi:PKD repeat protein
VSSLDVGVNAILDPTDTICEGNFSPVVSVYNYGSQAITSLNINYSINGGSATTYSWTGAIPSGSATNITLPQIALSVGNQSITVFTSSPNGGTDENATNNSISSNFVVASGANAVVTVVLDDWGSETTWSVSGSQGVVASGGPYQDQAQGAIISDRFCLATNCSVACATGGGSGCNYTFTVFDSFGDGQGYQTGSISVTTPAGVTTFTNNWGSTQTTSFCAPSAGAVSSSPDANFNIQDNTVCPGTQVDFTSTSTNNPTNYSWTFEGGTPSTSSASNPQNIVWNTPGTYDVTLTVSNASGSDTYICSNCMTVYTPPIVTLTGTNPACNGQSTGSINSAVTGSGPFTYLWSNGSTAANATNLAAGSFTVSVTNSVGCVATGSATLANPPVLSVTTSGVNPTCSNNSNGSVSATAIGGTGNKTYLWTPGNAVTSSISNLLPGTYGVTVTDSRGCTATASSTLTAPPAITLNYSVANVLCSSGNTGSITGSASGGAGSYSYLWSPGNATSASINNLAGGNYSLTVTDGSGCTKNQIFTVSTPSPIVIAGTVTNPSCPGGNGSISVNATGGTGNKTYLWNTGVSTGTIVAAAGSYFVTATDANGCTSTQSFTVTSPVAPSIVSSIVSPSCFGGNNGSISLSLPGSTGNVTYNWGGGITGANRTGLSAGTYTVTAAYGAGCTVAGTFTLSQPSSLASSFVSVNHPACAGGNNGAIVAAATGGVSPYAFNWSDGAVDASRQNLDAGSYSLNVIDANGCSLSSVVTLTDPPAIEVSGVITDAQCGEANGAIQVSVINANGAISYNWSNIQVQGSNPSGLAAGSYTLSITDENDCGASQTFFVQTPGDIELSAVITNASCANLSNGSVQLQVTGGSAPYAIVWSNGFQGLNLSQAMAGTYSVSVTDAQNCSASESYTISSVYAVSISVNGMNPLCNESQNGSATATLNGGIGDVTYQWSNGFSGPLATGLSGGSTYSVTGTDSNGCSANGAVTLTAPPALTVVSSFTPPSCGGVNNGSVFFSVSGGTGEYSYSWNDGDTE